MIDIILDDDERIKNWVISQLKCDFETPLYRSIGLARNGKIVGGVVYHDWSCGDITITAAARDKKCLTRRTLKALFWTYPFNVLGVQRISAHTLRNGYMDRLMKRLGFTHEGIIRRGRDGRDVDMWGMLKDECKWR